MAYQTEHQYEVYYLQDMLNRKYGVKIRDSRITHDPFDFVKKLEFLLDSKQILSVELDNGFNIEDIMDKLKEKYPELFI